jgi:hypothetical protein
MELSPLMLNTLVKIAFAVVVVLASLVASFARHTGLAPHEMRQPRHSVLARNAAKATSLPQPRITLRSWFIPVAFAGPPKTSLAIREPNFTRAE